MKIKKISFICPKCKKEYINEFLLSYSSGFENVAKEFSDNNIIITTCEKCKIKLVQKSFLKYFNENGEYYPIVENVELNNEFDEFDLYLKTLESIKDFFECNLSGNIEIMSKIEKSDTQIKGIMVIKGINENSEFELLRAVIGKYEIVMGDRKNKFMENSLKNVVNTLVNDIYEYVFIDDCSGFVGKKNNSNISCNLIIER